jgi:hypothetical protein
MRKLAIDQPIGMGQARAVSGGFEFGKGVHHAGKAELGELIEHWMGQQVPFSFVVSRSSGGPDVAVQDRDSIGRWRRCGVPVELVGEDRAHRSIGQRVDLDGADCRRFQASGTERPQQADNAKAGAKALLRVRSALQDQVA